MGSDLSQRVIGCAMKVHRVLGPGFLESVYQKALAIELAKAGMSVVCEKRLQVVYEGNVVGDFEADMCVDDVLLIENKVARGFTFLHEVQLVNYLTATGTDYGLLLNFGAARLEFKRKWRVVRPEIGNIN